MKKEQSVSVASGIKEVVQKAKEFKARKEGMKFLIKVAELNAQMKEAEERLKKFVKDNGLSEEIIEEAKGLTNEDIEAIREFLSMESGEEKRNNGFTYANLVGNLTPQGIVTTPYYCTSNGTGSSLV